MALNGHVPNVETLITSEIAALQKKYAELWERISEVLKQLTAIVEL